MASKIEICNLALQNLGANSITSLNEGSKEATECNLRFDTARRALLQMHPWSFAKKRALLNRETSTPAFNYSYQFTLPSDCLQVLITSIEEQQQDMGYSVYRDNTISINPVYGDRIDKYKIEGRKLLSNSQDVNIVYIADITDTEQFDPIFTDLLARYLASLIGLRIISKSERDTQYQIFKQELEEYQSINSQQGVIDVISRSPFLEARY